jgi:hypothetical protein
MTLPHPQARKDHCGKKDIPGGERVLGNLVKRAVDVANDWNGQNEVNPAKDYALDAWLHDASFPCDERAWVVETAVFMVASSSVVLAFL